MAPSATKKHVDRFGTITSTSTILLSYEIAPLVFIIIFIRRLTYYQRFAMVAGMMLCAMIVDNVFRVNATSPCDWLKCRDPWGFPDFNNKLALEVGIIEKTKLECP